TGGMAAPITPGPTHGDRSMLEAASAPIAQADVPAAPRRPDAPAPAPDAPAGPASTTATEEQVPPSGPLPDVVGWIGLALVVALILAVALRLLRRKREGAPEALPPRPERIEAPPAPAPTPQEREAAAARRRAAYAASQLAGRVGRARRRAAHEALPAQERAAR